MVTGQSTENIPDQSGSSDEQGMHRAAGVWVVWTCLLRPVLEMGVELGSPRTPPGNFCLSGSAGWRTEQELR